MVAGAAFFAANGADDTNTVHVRLSDTGEIILDSVIKGDTVREVLNYVQFSADALVSRLRRDI